MDRLVPRTPTLLVASLSWWQVMSSAVHEGPMFVTPVQALVWVVLATLWAGVNYGATCPSRLGSRLSPTPLCRYTVTRTSCPSRTLKVPPRWLVTWASPCLVVVTVLVSEGPLRATFTLLIGMSTLSVYSTVTAPSTLSRGRTSVRRIRMIRGRLFPMLWFSLPTVSTSES